MSLPSRGGEGHFGFVADTFEVRIRGVSLGGAGVVPRLRVRDARVTETHPDTL